MDASEINESPEENNEILPTTLISVERVFCDDETNDVNNSQTSKKSILDTKNSRNKEDANIEETDKIYFEFKCEFCTCIFEFQRDLLQHYEIDHGMYDVYMDNLDFSILHNSFLYL